MSARAVIRSPWVHRAIALLLALLLDRGLAQAQGWNATWENDSFIPWGSDELYTNGLRFTFRHDFKKAKPLEKWLVHGYPLAGKERSYLAGESVVFGQNFFTPTIITSYDVDPTDRPYYGLLYAGLRVDATETGNDRPTHFQARRQHSLELALGVVGPAALAEPTQSAVHLLRENRIPKGWDHQIGTSIAPFASLGSRVKLGWHWADLTPSAGVMVSNVQTHASAGATLRVGWNMSGFPALLIPANAVGSEQRHDAEIAFVAGVEGRAFAYNSLVEGDLFGERTELTAEPYVGDFRWGVSLRLTDWRISGTVVRRSSEAKGDGLASRYHDYASVALAYEPGTRTPEDRKGSPVGWIADRFFARAFRNLWIEGGIGGGVATGADADPESRGTCTNMRYSFGAERKRLSVGYETVGALREGGQPPTPADPHLDTFFINRVIYARWETPLRLWRGGFQARLGASPWASARVQSTLATDHFYSREDTGWGYLGGLAYIVHLGDHAGVGLDAAGNVLDVESDLGSDAHFMAYTLTVQWRP